MPDVIYNNSSSIETFLELFLPNELKAMDARSTQAQASLNLYIPNCQPVRQGKFLDFVLATFFVKLRRNMDKTAPFSRVIKFQNSSKSHSIRKLENTLIFR